MPSLKILLITIFVKYSLCSEDDPITTLSPKLPTPWDPWFVRKNASNVCILARFGAEFIVYDTKIKSKEFIMPFNAIVGDGSDCGDEHQTIQLLFEDKKLSFTFAKDKDSVFVDNIEFTYDKKTVEYKEKSFKTPEKFGYKCFTEQTIELSKSVKMKIENVKFEAFRNGNYSIDEPEQWERVGLKCELDRVRTDAYTITFISLGVGILVLGIITLVAIWSGRRQEKLMLKVKMQRQWTVEDSHLNAINISSRSTSTQSILENNNNFNYQKY